MKKLLLITVLAILVVAATAQETRKTFCEIVGTGKVLSSKVKIQIDFGQKTSYFDGRRHELFSKISVEI